MTFGLIVKVAFQQTFGNMIKMLRHILMPKNDRGSISHIFFATLLILLAFGLLMLFSASYSSGYYYDGDSYSVIVPQLKVAIVGVVFAWLISNLDYRTFGLMFWTLYIVTLILLVWALFSEAKNGCHRWIYIGSSSFQPSELAKFCAILWVANYTNKHHEQRHTLVHGLIIPALPIIPIVILLLKEPHHSATILVLGIFAAMLFCGGCALKYLFPAGLLGAAGVWYILISRAESGSYVGSRLGGAWGVNPGDTSEMVWQTKQSIYAIALGGIKGVGISQSNQKHQWLPEATNDFIFSILCEELGFIGALICILLFAALIFQGIMIALRAPDYYGTMLGIGIMAQIGLQVFCHIGVVSALLPNTGISLPFFSSGGTSLLILLCEMGIMLSISRAGNARIERMQKQQKEELNERLRRTAAAHIMREVK